MKKLWILLVALALLAATPIFAADVTVGGEFMSYVNSDFVHALGSGFPKAELNITSAVDDFNTVKLELDSEGGAWPGTVAVDDFRLITDFGAALGLPIGLKGTFGFFDTYFTGWYYYDATGWTWYYDWSNQVINFDNNAGAVQLDAAVGPVNVHWYNDFVGENFAVGADASFAGVSLWLAFADSFRDFSAGTLSVEAAYSAAFGDFALDLGGFFRYGLADLSAAESLNAKIYSYGVNLGAGYSMFHLAGGIEGDEAHGLDNVIAELTVAPLDALKIGVAMMMDLGLDAGAVTDPTDPDYTGPRGTEINTSSFVGVDIGVTYMVGGTKFALGYVIPGEDKNDMVVWTSGDNYAAQGLYFGVYTAY